jgi:3-dehydroquinate dehydratase/shikimate dehydrogenase
MRDFSAPSICVTVTAATMAELCRARNEVSEGDLVELRLDTVSDPDPAAALAGRRRPVVITCRASWEGGHFNGSEEERLALLARAWELGAEYVDVEWLAAGSDAFLRRTGGRRVVLSTHDFAGVPPDLESRFRALAATSAEIVKIAVTAQRLSDTTPLFALSHVADGRSFVALAMGSPGVPTRVLAARLGSRWSYAGTGWVPGQVSPKRLVDEFRFRHVSARTPVYGVVGRPIMHSLSPAMHNAAFEAEGIDGVYLPFEAASVDDFLEFADALGVAGASVTAPFKLALSGVTELDAAAQRVGALNTLRRSPGGWQGTNTDVEGFVAPLARRLELAGTRAAVLGAGGAARAVAVALRDRGARVVLHARRVDQARDVAHDVGVEFATWPPEPGSWDLLVNATPVGTAPHGEQTPWVDARLDGRFVYDLVYNPPVTRLLRDAAAAGCETLGGLEMLVAQAQRQFEWWTGRRPDEAVMREAALERLRAISPAGATEVAAYETSRRAEL